MTYQNIFNRLWKNYSDQNPSVKKIHDLFRSKGETVLNDHIAFRTFNDPRVSIDVMAKLFESVGYKQVGEYHFKVKKLKAIHYENNLIKNSPKVFISELKLEECSEFLQNTVKETLDIVPDSIFQSEELIFKGAVWESFSYETYNRLREESEYAAWLYVFGFRTNHFTVNVNAFNSFNSLGEVNNFLKDSGFVLNSSGGEIKGNPSMLLEQSSIMADIINVKFIEGSYDIPACYYEFALRYEDTNGNLFQGFHADSADKIFESTDFYKK